MKNIIHLILILVVSVFFSSCEKDTNGRMPDDIQDSNTGVLIVTESDPFINVGTPGDYEISIDVDLLFEGDFEKIDVMVVMNGDYTNQYVLQTVTSVPQSITLSSQDFVDAVDGLNSTAEIAEGDAFNLFTNITLSDGTYIPGYLEDGTPTNSPSVRNITGILKGGASNITIPVPCAYAQANVVGSYHCVSADWGSEGDIDITADDSDPFVVYVAGLETIEGLVEDNGPLKMIINNDYSISAPRHIIASSLAPWGLSYTNLAYEGSGFLNTCDNSYQMTFEITVDQGSFGLYNFTFTKN